LSEDVSVIAVGRQYFRRDQNDGVSPPDLSKDCSYADHIVHARGKRTKFTSLTLDIARCHDFGECTYKLLRELAEAERHKIIEHEHLLARLQQTASQGEKDERLKAIHALRYARVRKEGLLDWQFDISRVARKDLISWAHRQIQQYFVKC
jgi:hypothetical protein